MQRHARRWGLMLFVLVLVVTLADRGWQMLRAWLSPVGSANWIWAEAPEEQAVPSAFYALRDFELPAQPVEARLWALGDEEYAVFVNGHQVGSNRYLDGAPLDLYDPASLLRPGANRVHAEVRSTWGKGGLLLSLEVRYDREDNFETIVVTDGSWQIVERHALGLVRGWSLASSEEVGRPQLWGRPPTGRWGLPEAVSEATDFLDDRPANVRPAVDITPHPKLPNVVTLDWGEVVTGYVELDLRTDDLPWALLYFSDEVPSTEYRPPDAELVAVHGSGLWRAAVPHRFRYLQVLGLSEVSAARVFEVESTSVQKQIGVSAAAFTAPTGLFGLDVPPRLRPIPEYVARRVGREPGPVPPAAMP